MVPTTTGQVGAIGERRRAIGLTQAQLAQAAGCSVQFIEKLEAGAIPKRSRVLPAVLAILDALNSEAAPAQDGFAKTSEATAHAEA